MKKLFLLSVAALFNLSVFAQSKLFSMEDAVINSSLLPQNLKAIQWIAKTNNISYIGKANGIECLIRINKDKSNDTLLYASDIDKSKKNFQALTWLNENEFLYNDNSDYFIFNLTNKTNKLFIDLNENASNQEWSNSKKMIAYTVDNNLHLADEFSKKAITTEANKDILFGQAVHRNEFGINKGIFWSNNDAMIAFYRMDQSMVTDYPLVDINTTPAKLNNIKYPMAGQTSHEVSIGVYDVKSGSTKYLKIDGAKDQYLTNIAWTNDSKYIAVAVVSRSYQTMSLNLYDAQTGEFVKTLLTEKHDKYVEPNEPARFLSNGDFIWHSEQDGYKHLYLYNKNGKLIKQLTKGNWVVTNFLGTSDDLKKVYYMSTEKSALERHLYSLEISTLKKSLHTSEAGMHNVILNSNKSEYIDIYSNYTTPRVINWTSTSNKKIKELLNASNPIKDYALGEQEVFTIKAADNKTDLYARIYRPINFDKNKKYPVVVYVYGGPHVQLITNSWLAGANLWFQLMAQKGYVVFTVDARGTMYRGRDFEQATFRQLGKVELADQLKGIDYLKTLNYVDTNRIGVHGWSYGGFMTTTMMTKANKVFKVGVAGGPVIDWAMYEVMYTERYMDTPSENPEGYKENNLLNQVENLKGRLLMIHGTSDDVVVWQHSLAFMKKCVEKGVMLDYFAYPQHQHNVRGRDRVHLMNTITRYFDEHL